jgi:oligoendopeptidase F
MTNDKSKKLGGDVEEQGFEPSGWTLEVLLPAHEGTELERILTELERQVAQFEASREHLSPEINSEEFLELMRLYEAIGVTMRRLGGYAQLWFAEDTQSQEALGFLGRMEQLSTEVQNRLLFFSLWWKGLDEEPARRLIAASGDSAYYLESLRRFKPYTLSEPEEKIVNLKDVNGPNALVKLYEMITNRFSFRLEIGGEVKEMTRDELAAYVRDPSPEMRAAAYEELFRVYSDEGAVLAQIYSHLVRDWGSENVTLRGFASPVSVRNLGNDIPDPVVETLLAVCRENMPIFHRYFRLKARWLGVERLRRYDVYAPLQASDKTYPFSEAVGMVFDSLTQFSPALAHHARRVFTDGHIDSEVRPGKQGGAFCAGMLPSVTPWVLVNYVGKTEDVLTLAHELGHATHALMAGDHSVFTYHSALPLAETASVFSEMILNDRLLREEEDRAVRRTLLARVLDDAYATVARQAYFVLFEQEAHQRAVEGATADDLCALYLDNLHEQFGDAVEVSDDFGWEWIAIPHIYATPFYCYAYSFGHLLVLALYQQYKNEGADFVPRFLRILTYGGSQSPAHIIGEAGFDMASPDFWQGGFDVLRGMLDELEALSP